MGISGWVKRRAGSTWRKYLIRTLPAGEQWVTSVSGPGESEAKPGPLCEVSVGVDRDEGFRWGKAAVEALVARKRRRK